MKRTLIILALIVGLLSTAGWIQSQPTPQTWEYKFVYQCDEKKANAQAADGWELVNLSMAVHGSISVGTCVFKRTAP